MWVTGCGVGHIAVRIRWRRLEEWIQLIVLDVYGEPPPIFVLQPAPHRMTQHIVRHNRVARDAARDARVL